MKSFVCLNRTHRIIVSNTSCRFKHILLFCSQGIVVAVRLLGGRFLELDRGTGAYEDIWDKKAIEKTSAALREGQQEIRDQISAAAAVATMRMDEKSHPSSGVS